MSAVLRPPEQHDATASEAVLQIRAQIRRLPLTHTNLVTLITAVASYAADIHCDGIEAVSEHLDCAADACEGCYIPSREAMHVREPR